MNIDKSLTIGQLFKKIRKDKGLSQKELCDGICSDSVISHIETDRQYPSAHIWGKLAERLNVPVHAIMGEHEKEMDVSFQLDMVRVYIEKGDYVHAFEMIEKLGEDANLLEHQRVELIMCSGECFVKSCSRFISLSGKRSGFLIFIGGEVFARLSYATYRHMTITGGEKEKQEDIIGRQPSVFLLQTHVQNKRI